MEPARIALEGKDEPLISIAWPGDLSGVRLQGIRPYVVAEGIRYDAPNEVRLDGNRTDDGLGVVTLNDLGEERGLSLILKFEVSSSVVTIHPRVENRGAKPVRVDFVAPVNLRADRSGLLRLGDDDRTCRALAMSEFASGYGTRIEFLSTDTRPDEYAWTNRSVTVRSEGVTLVRSDQSGLALAAGFIDFRGGFSTLAVSHGTQHPPPDEHLRGFVAEFEHMKEIPAGGAADTAPLRLEAGRDPFELLESYAAATARRMGIRLPKDVPCGWISWYAYRLDMSEETVRANAEVAARTILPLGGNLCHLDLGWNKDDRPGDWLETNDRFPRGLKALCDELREQGFTVAAWSTPLVVSAKSTVAREHPEWLLRDEQGSPISMGEWYWEPVEPLFSLDPTHPGVHEWLFKVYRTLYDWGVRAFKTDFAPAFIGGLGRSGTPAETLRRTPPVYFDPSLNRMEACRKVFGIIRKAIGDSHLTTCNVPAFGTVGIADSMFLAHDVGNLTDSESLDERPLRRGWDYFRARSRHIATRYFFHDRMWLSNPDCVVAENDAADRHARCRMQMVALAGGQYKCSNRLPGWRPDRMAMFLKGLPRYGVAARPVDLFESEFPAVFDLPVEAQWGAWHVVGLFNWESSAREIAFKLSQLKPAVTGRQLVWDFWEARFLGRLDDEVRVEIPGESCALLCVRPAPSHPEILSTDMHVTQGGVEVVERNWNASDRVLSGLCRRAEGMSGRVFIYVPEGLACPSAVRAADGGTILEVPLTFDEPEVRWERSFVVA